MHGDGDVLRGIAVSPDGKTLAVVSGGGRVLFFDARTYAQIGDPLPPGLRAEAALRTALTGEPSRSAATTSSPHRRANA